MFCATYASEVIVNHHPEACLVHDIVWDIPFGTDAQLLLIHVPNLMDEQPLSTTLNLQTLYFDQEHSILFFNRKSYKS